MERYAHMCNTIILQNKYSFKRIRAPSCLLVFLFSCLIVFPTFLYSAFSPTHSFPLFSFAKSYLSKSYFRIYIMLFSKRCNTTSCQIQFINVILEIDIWLPQKNKKKKMKNKKATARLVYFISSGNNAVSCFFTRYPCNWRRGRKVMNMNMTICNLFTFYQQSTHILLTNTLSNSIPFIVSLPCLHCIFIVSLL